MDNNVLKQKELTQDEKNLETIKEQNILLKQALHEIQSLKRQNHILYSKQDVFDKIYKMMTLNDRNNHGCVSEKGPDMEWQIEKYLNQ